jgi:lipopolysaccharide transport system permease protein
MLNELKELWRFRELLLSMVERELRIRYKNSVLGFFWSLLNPLITVVVMTLVFKNFLANDTPNLSAYILAAYLPFMFFQMCLLDSAQSVVVALPLVKKIYFPREVLPLTMVISNFIHFLLALLVFFLFMICFVWVQDPRVFPISWTVVFLPILLIIHLALVTGLSLLISALNTFYEDVKYIVSVLLYLLFFVSPVMYFSENVWHSFRNWPAGYVLFHLNPVATLCTAYRKVLVAPQPVKTGNIVIDALPLDWALIGYAAVFSFSILALGYWVFNRMKWRFVERP